MPAPSTISGNIDLITAPRVTGGQLICSNIPIGAIALASMGTNTAGVTNQWWITEIMVPYNRVVNNVNVLAGGTATTDKIMAAIYRSDGTLVGNTATAGVLLSGANTFQVLPMTAATQLTGPGQYYVYVNTNGATAGDIQTVAAPYLICAGVLAGTFGTVPATVTPPSTFTTGNAPIVYLN